MPALQKEMQASSTSNFRYFTCLLDKGHINSRRFICFPKFRFSDQRKTPQCKTGLCPNNKNRKNVLKYQSHSPCLFINNQIPSLFYLCLFCKKFFCIFLNICYLFCSQIHKIAVIHRAIRILYIHHLSIFLSNRIEPYFLWYIVNFTLLH